MLRFCPPTRNPCQQCWSLHGRQAVARLESITRTVLSSLAQSSALGLRGDAFSPLLDNLPLALLTVSSSVLTFLRYKECSTSALCTEAHCDKGLLTAIFAPGLGLQVREPAWEAKCGASHAYIHVVLPTLLCQDSVPENVVSIGMYEKQCSGHQ